MMAALIDSGFFYAVLDKGDTNHYRVKTVLSEIDDTLLMPVVVLVEVSYLLQARIGHKAMRQMIERLECGPVCIEPVMKSDLPRIHGILEQYSDIRLDFVDAAITAIAERLDIRRILTVDQRDFRIIRPVHCEYFEILPS